LSPSLSPFFFFFSFFFVDVKDAAPAPPPSDQTVPAPRTPLLKRKSPPLPPRAILALLVGDRVSFLYFAPGFVYKEKIPPWHFLPSVSSSLPARQPFPFLSSTLGTQFRSPSYEWGRRRPPFRFFQRPSPLVPFCEDRFQPLLLETKTRPAFPSRHNAGASPNSFLFLFSPFLRPHLPRKLLLRGPLSNFSGCIPEHGTPNRQHPGFSGRAPSLLYVLTASFPPGGGCRQSPFLVDPRQLVFPTLFFTPLPRSSSPRFPSFLPPLRQFRRQILCLFVPINNRPVGPLFFFYVLNRFCTIGGLFC